MNDATRNNTESESQETMAEPAPRSGLLILEIALNLGRIARLVTNGLTALGNGAIGFATQSKQIPRQLKAEKSVLPVKKPVEAAAADEAGPSPEAPETDESGEVSPANGEPAEETPVEGENVDDADAAPEETVSEESAEKKTKSTKKTK
jgi:hypothetical protein